MAIEPEVTFNIDLANGPTAYRFCREAANVLGIEWNDEYEECALDELDGDAVHHWSEVLENAGYYVWWDAGDAVVWNLEPLSDDDRDEFIEEMCNR